MVAGSECLARNNCDVSFRKQFTGELERILYAAAGESNTNVRIRVERAFGRDNGYAWNLAQAIDHEIAPAPVFSQHLRNRILGAAHGLHGCFLGDRGWI